MLGSRQIGSRVVVRRVVDVVDGRRRFTDVIGELREVSPAQVRVRRDNGEIEEIPTEAVVAGKVIPAKRTSYRAIAQLELACAAAWPAVETRWLGDWLLRASGGWTNRANTALTVGDPGSDLGSAIEAVCDWYRERELRPGFTVPLPLAKRVASTLHEAGWHATQTVSVLTCPIEQLRAADAQTVIAPSPSPPWLEVLAANRGALTPEARSVLGSGDRRGFASLCHHRDLIAVGRVAIEQDVAVMTSIHVAPVARRKGLAERVARAMADWAAQRGAQRVCVQVEQDNPAALALYAKLGFTPHHEYLNMRPAE